MTIYRKYNPDYHSSLCQCWRDKANIPIEITDEQIYNIVEKNSLYYGNSQTDEENQLEFQFLRQELGLPNK